MFQSESVVGFAQSAFIAVLIGAVGYIVTILASRLTKYLVTRFIEPSWSNFVANLVRLLLLIWTGQLMLEETGAAGLFVILATALTGAFAIGSERLASDTVSGVRLLLYRHYKVGDWVTLAGEYGKVTEITLASTILSTRDRDVVVVPNSRVADDVLINHSMIPSKIVNMTVTIPISEDVDKVIEALGHVIENFSYLAKGCNSKVFLSEVKLNSYFFTLRIYVPDELDSEEEQSKMMVTTVKVLAEHNVPFAQEASGLRIGRETSKVFKTLEVSPSSLSLAKGEAGLLQKT